MSATRRLFWALIPVVLIATACGNRAGRPTAAGPAQVETQPGAASAGGSQSYTQTPAGDSGAGAVASTPAAGSGSGGTAPGGGVTASPAGNAATGSASGSSTRQAAGPPSPNPSSGGASAGRAATNSPSAAASPTPGLPAPGGGPAPATGGAKSPVTVGNVGTWSGVFGGIGIPELHGVKAWVGDVNARGGLAGHPVRLVSYDDGGEPGRALSSAQRLVEQDKAIVILGVFQPTTEQAVTAYLEQKQIPLMVT